MDGDDTEVVGTIALPGVLPRAIGYRACSGCMWGVKETGDLVCRVNPPQATFIAMPAMVPGPGGRPQHGFEIKNFAGFPVVRPDQWCGKFEKRG